MKWKWIICVGAVLLALGDDADATTISFDPAAPSVAVGAMFDVQVVISDLGDFVAPSLAAFDLDILFDPAVLSVVAVASGGFLGDPGFETSVFLDEPAPGVLDTREVSFLSAVALDGLQPDTFLLGTITFEAVGAGTSSLIFDQHLLSDGFGFPLAATALADSVEVVPEPSTALLLILGIVGMASYRRPANAGAS